MQGTGRGGAPLSCILFKSAEIMVHLNLQRQQRWEGQGPGSPEALGKKEKRDWSKRFPSLLNVMSLLFPGIMLLHLLVRGSWRLPAT